MIETKDRPPSLDGIIDSKIVATKCSFNFELNNKKWKLKPILYLNYKIVATISYFLGLSRIHDLFLLGLLSP